ncbi:MAG: hypothetical protein ACF787_04620 [Rhodopirellula sp. JB053]
MRSRWAGERLRRRTHHVPLRWITLFVLGCLLSTWTPVGAEDFTFSCWFNGWRKNANDSSADVFAIETNRYAMILDVADFDRFRLGRIENSVSYEQAVRHKTEKLLRLPDAELLIEMEVDGVRYVARTCEAGLQSGVKHLSSVRLWESGRYVQHYDFLKLQFFSETGRVFKCDARMDLVAWPDSLTLNLIVSGAMDCNRCEMRLGVDSRVGKWQEATAFDGPLRDGEEKRLSLTCPMRDASRSEGNADSAKVSVSVVGGKTLPVRFDRHKNCYVATAEDLRRRRGPASRELREYDEFEITVAGTNESVPLLIDLRPPASVIGVCPVLCDEAGRPNGLPVQLSKNWHYAPMGSYVMTYAILPPADEPTTYRLKMVYGFYGDLPAASHAQLCLIGYGGNGRWDQLAIGSWGETICFDMDMSLVDVAVTDIRTLMTRDGVKGKKWGWTNAGWGGDWLNLSDTRQAKYFPNGLKTAYLSHGPCLTDVRHEGYYGRDREVELSARVQTLRTDDYCRTFMNLAYEFERDVDVEKVWLFKLGRTFTYQTPRLDYGNAEGIIRSLDVPVDVPKGELFVKSTDFTGDAPYWVSFTGASEAGAKRSKPNGYRSLIVRRYHAEINGRQYEKPTIRCPAHASEPTNLDLELLPPEGILRFRKGDRIELELELITLPRVADDYYGPNESFRNHLEANPASWATTYREANGNDLHVTVDGGRLRQRYPVVVDVEQSTVSMEIKGGVGAVPVQFRGLPNEKGFALYRLVDGRRVALDQSVHGMDFWQVEFDTATETYRATFNLPLDRTATSRWVFETRATQRQ